MADHALRPYRARALDELRALLREKIRRIVLVSPTGSGKTQCASEMIASAVAKGGRVVFLAHRRELIWQCSKRLDGEGVGHGILMADNPRFKPEAQVQVASIQTLARRLDKLPPATLVIIDEARHARSKTYACVLDRYPAAAVIGLDATPWRADGKGLKEIFDASVVAATSARVDRAGIPRPLHRLRLPIAEHEWRPQSQGRLRPDATQGGRLEGRGNSPGRSSTSGSPTQSAGARSYSASRSRTASRCENKFIAAGARAEQVDARDAEGDPLRHIGAAGEWRNGSGHELQRAHGGL